MDFTDTIALVTGSSRGIGAAVARAFVRAGAGVVINHRAVGGSSEARARELAAEIEAMGRPALVVPADVADREAVRGLVAAVRERFGRLDHLILNAARAPFKPMERLLDRELHQLVETNFVGQVRCLRESLPLLEASGGRVVFVSSLGSRFYSPEYPLGAMKAAMEATVRHWAESLRPRGINANAVCGGIVKTDAFKVLRQVWDGLDQIPDELCATPEEIADAVLFLCAPESRGVRGQTLVVDRGLSNRLHI